MGQMLHINPLCTPSFPISLVKTESGFVVRSVETGLGRGTLVVAVISAHSYPFVAFSDLICDLEDTVQVFLECTVPPNSKETELEISNQEASLSAGKSSGCHFAQQSASLQLFPMVQIFLRSLGIIQQYSIMRLWGQF